MRAVVRTSRGYAPLGSVATPKVKVLHPLVTGVYYIEGTLASSGYIRRLQ